MKNRIGFFGGSFNPVTNAHIELIREVIKKENLDKVYFVPMGDFYSKDGLIPLEDRIKMLEFAINKEDKMEILNISNKYKKTYAIDTFKVIDKKFPNNERFFIMGSDNYKNINQWKKAEELKNNYNYIILDRKNGKTSNISSSLVREKILHDKEVGNLIPKQVFDYITQKKLYK